MSIEKPTKIYLTRNDKYFLTYEDASIEHAEIGADPRDMAELELYGLQSHNEKIARAAFHAGRKWGCMPSGVYDDSDDFLRSPEYKELVGVK